MTSEIEAAVVRLLKPSGNIVGAGFLVDDSHLITCAHVLQAALRPTETSDQPPGRVSIDFPLIAPGKVLEAELVFTKPVEDVAGLQVLGQLPPEARPVSLLLANAVWGHAFRTFGFPRHYEAGVWATGVVRGYQAQGWLQIEGEGQTGYRVQPGFSGAPVWDEELGGVLGMVTTSDRKEETRAAFIIPSARLVQLWPELAPKRFQPEEIENLQRQLETLLSIQQRSATPRRFQTRIDSVRSTIDNWDERIDRQRDRIASGLAEERERGEVYPRPPTKKVPVVGQRPQDVTDYFKDRSEQQKALARMLSEPTTRLVSIIGQGGMGKTALASKVLKDLERFHWPHTEERVPLDGIVYLSTRTTDVTLERIFLNCARLLPPTQEQQLAATWINTDLDRVVKISTLLEYMAQGTYVILLDNLEDMLDEEGQFTDSDLKTFFENSLMYQHGIRLLVTTRIPLAFKREVMRYDQQIKLLDGLPVTDAVALLRELDPNGDLGLQDAPIETLERAAVTLHGIPRALELLTGVLAHDPFLTLDQVLDNYYEQDDVVQVLIEDNYSRLDQGARLVMDALAIYRRAVPVLAVDFLLEPFAPGLDVPAILKRLARTHIAHVDRDSKTVTLHPIDQDYVLSQLPSNQRGGERYTVQMLERRAAAYYHQIRKPEESWHNLDDLAPQLLEFEHLFRAADFDEAYKLTEPISFNALFSWGYYEKLAGLWERLLGHLTRPILQTALMGHLGIVYRVLGRHVEAFELTKEALAISERIGSLRWQSAWLGNLGILYRDVGQPQRAVDLFEQAFDVARKDNNLPGQVQWLNSMSNAYRRLGLTGQAVDTYEKGIRLASEIGQESGADFRLLGLGKVLLENGQIAAARHNFAKVEAMDIPHTNFRASLGLGMAAFLQGDAAAVDFFLETIDRCEKIMEMSPRSVQALLSLATALVGYAICNPGWQEENQRAVLLRPAWQAFQRALDNNQSPGLLFDYHEYLKVLQEYQVAGLEPIIELLEAAV